MPQTAEQKLIAIENIISGTDPGPTPAPVGWHRSPGAPYVPGEPSAADNPQRAKELAAQFRDVNGTVFVVPPDCEAALADCDYIALDTTTAAQIDAKLEGGGRTDKQSVIYQRMTGKTQGGGGLGGRLRLMYPETTLADVIRAPGAVLGGNIG